jgi:hypothetical protein
MFDGQAPHADQTSRVNRLLNAGEEEEDGDLDNGNDDSFSFTTKLPCKTRNNRTTNGGIQSPRASHTRRAV